MAIGFDIVIPDRLITKLAEADRRLKTISQTSEETKNRVVRAFNQMTLGADEFLKKLQQINTEVGKLGNVKLQITTTNTTQSVDDINKLLQLTKELTDAQKKQLEAQARAELAKKAKSDMQETTKRQISEEQRLTAQIKAQNAELSAEYKRRSKENISIADNEARKRIAANRLATNEIIAQMQRETRFRIQEANRIAKLTQMPTTITRKDVGRIIDVSRNAKSINQIQTAIKNLEKAKRDLDITDKKYQKTISAINREIDRQRQKLNSLNGEMGIFKKTQTTLMNHAQQLRRMLALAFSVSQITGYIKKMVEVRGEFELQRKSLAAIIHSKDEADKLWSQTLDLAVRSPFQIRELISYTKQLAAYRIETEKLHTTTKMLADVSAGLGVDMQRLILAYGQVKAANYLRGTELRQFSEAGINILGELSKYFTELEGRAISVGDVFERVSKRMVSFSDVEEIFKRITSEGGVFYNMQEIQAETVKGLVRNLNDQIDIMFDSIGRNNDDTIRGSIKFVKQLVESWREVAFIMEKVVTGAVLWKTVSFTFASGMKDATNSTLWFNNALKTKIGQTLADVKTMTWQEAKILGVTRAQYMMGKSTMLLQGALKGLWNITKTAAPFLIIAGVLELWRVMTKATREAQRLKKELEGLINQDVSNLNSSIERYRSLSTRLSEVNKGSNEHKDIISKLNSEYGEYINFIVDEETSMQKLADAYEEVVKRMQEKQALSSFEKGMSSIAESYGNALTDAKKEFYDMFEGASIKSMTDDFKFFVPTKKEIDDIYSLVQQKIKELDADQIDSLDEQQRIIQDIISGYYGDDYFLVRDYSQSIELIDILVKKKKQEYDLQNEINAQYKEVLSSREAQLELEKLRNKYAEDRRKIENSTYTNFEKQKALSALKDEEDLAVIDLKVRFGMLSEQGAKTERDKIINWATELTNDINNTISENLSIDFSEEDLSKVLITREFQQSKSTGEYIKQIKSGWEQQNAIIQEQISLKSEGLTIDDSLLDNAVKMEELYRKVADLLGIELKYEEKINDETKESINSKLPLEYQITLEESLKSQKKLLEEANKKKTEAIALQEMLNASQNRGVDISEEQLKKAEEDVKYWTERWRLLGGTESTGGGNSNDKFQERLRILREMYDSYKDLNETFDPKKSIEGVDDKYRQAFKDAFGFDFDVWGNFFTNEDDYREALQKLKVMTKDAKDQLKVEIEKGRITWDIAIKLKTDQDKDLKDELQSYFDQYESMLELNKLGISGDAAYSLFGIESMDLDKLRSVVDQFKDQFIGTDMEDEYKKFQDKLTEMEVKAQQERLKKYLGNIRDNISDRAKLKIEELQKLKEIEDSFVAKEGASEEEKQAIETAKKLAIEGLKESTKQQLQKMDWEDFQKSDYFISMFDDLDNASSMAINSMITQLENYKDQWTDMPLDDMKKVIDLINKLKDAADEKITNPFYYAKKLNRDIASDGRSKSQAESDFKSYTQTADDADEQVRLYEQVLIAKTKILDIEQQELMLGKGNLWLLELSDEEINDMLETEKNISKQNRANASLAQQQLQRYAKLTNQYEKQAQVLADIRGSFNNLVGAATELGEALDMDEISKMWTEIGGNVFDTGLAIAEGVLGLKAQKLALDEDATAAEMFGYKMNMALGIIGYIVMAIQLVAKVITAIAKAHDNTLQKQIERDAEAAELLQKRFEKLEKAIDNAMSFGEYQKEFDEAKRNLEEQIRLTEDMIALEEDKKKTDKDAIKGYKDEIEDYNEQLQEMEEKRISDMGGFGSQEAIKDATEGFIDAWAEAYNETGDGLDALKDKWDEYFQNLLKKQMMMKVASKYMESVLKEINTALEDDILTGEEMEKLKTVRDESSEQLNAIMKQLAEAMSWEGGLGGGSELDGLSESIQGVTEVTAQALEAILNSMRFYVIDNNKQLIEIANTLLSWESPTSPILAELKAQTSYLSSIESLFNSVIDRSGSPAVRIR